MTDYMALQCSSMKEKTFPFIPPKIKRLQGPQLQNQQYLIHKRHITQRNNNIIGIATTGKLFFLLFDKSTAFVRAVKGEQEQQLRPVLICCSVLVYLQVSVLQGHNTRCLSSQCAYRSKKQQPQLCLAHCKCIYSTQKTSISRIIRSMFSGGYDQRPSFGLNTACVCCNGKRAGKYTGCLRTAKQFVFSVDSFIHHQTKGLCQHSHTVFSVCCVGNYKALLAVLLIDSYIQVFSCLSIKAAVITPNMNYVQLCLLTASILHFWGVICMCFQHLYSLLCCNTQAHSPHNSMTVTIRDCNL